MEPIVALTDTHLSEHNIETIVSIFDEALECAVENGLTRIYHLGDNLHSRKTQSQSILTTFSDILDKFAEKNVQLVSIVGNHDKTDYRSEKSFLTPYKHHPALTLHETFHIEVLQDVIVCYLSYFDEDLYLMYVEQLLWELDQLVQADQQLRKLPKILLTHIGIEGAVMNNGKAIESEITTNILTVFDKVFIGHYHDRQTFSNIEYIGASLQHNFGELVEKGLCLIDDNLETSIMQLDFPRFITHTYKAEEVTDTIIEQLSEEKKSSGNAIRINIVGSESEIKTVNYEKINSVGIKVKKTSEVVTIEEVANRINPFSFEDLEQQLEKFCEEKDLDSDKAFELFNKIV